RAAVPYHGAARQADPALGSHDPGAPIAEAVAIGRGRHRGIGPQMVRKDDVGGARIVNVQRQYHGRRLVTFVDQLIADPDLHHGLLGCDGLGAAYVVDHVLSMTLTSTSMPRKEEAYPIKLPQSGTA